MKLTTIATACAGFIRSTTSAPPSSTTTSVSSSVSSNSSGIAVANVIAVHKPGVANPDYRKYWSETPVEIPFGKLFTSNQSVTGFRLSGLTVTVEDWPTPDKNQVVCQRYRDPYGIYPGSAPFNVTEEAYISTNSVPFGWVLCSIKPKGY